MNMSQITIIYHLIRYKFQGHDDKSLDELGNRLKSLVLYQYQVFCPLN